MSFRILFFGTSEFAIPSLEALMRDERFEILGVITQPDRPVGRRAVMASPAVKQHLLTAHSSVCTIHQPEKLQDEPFASWMREVGPTCDAFVVVSYGKILPKWLLALPKKGVVNVHGSLLPRWRGSSPIQAAIAAGDEVTGVTIMKLDAQMDHGPLLTQAKEVIRCNDTGGALHDRLATIGARLLPDTLATYLDDKIIPREQEHERATYCALLTRDDGRLDFTKPAAELERRIRAYTPWPGTWMELRGKRIKILAGQISTAMPNPNHPLTRRMTGEHLISNRLPAVVCGDGTLLELIKVQPEGKKGMGGKEFLHGQHVGFL